MIGLMDFTLKGVTRISRSGIDLRNTARDLADQRQVRGLMVAALLGMTVLWTSTPVKAQSDLVDVTNSGIPDPEPPQIAGDTVALDPSADMRRRVELAAEASTLWKQGYPKPDKADFDRYNADTIEQTFNALKDIDDPCEKAIYLKLSLDAHQDEFTETAAMEMMAELLWIKIWPNDAGKVDYVMKKFGHVVPGLGQVALANDVLSTIEVLQKYAKGSDAGWTGRWGFEIYRTAIAENWNDDRILQEVQTRQDRSETYSEVIHSLAEQMQKDQIELNDEFKARETEIESGLVEDIQEIDAALEVALSLIEKDRKEWEFELLKMGDNLNEIDRSSFKWVRDGTPEEKKELESVFQSREDAAERHASAERALAKTTAGAIRAAALANHEVDIRVMARAYSKAISEKLVQISKLQAESQTLHKFAAPVNAGNCDELRKPEIAMPLDKVEVAVIDKIRKLDKDRFETLMENAGVEVPAGFYGCICAELAQGGVGGGWTIKNGKCYSVGVLGGLGEVDMSGGDSAAAWTSCLDKVRIDRAGSPDGAPMHHILIDRLRQLPGKKIEASQ